MKQQSLRISLIAAACAAIGLAACGGGGGSPVTATASTTGTSGSSAMSGTVTGFGSVIVDGVRIDDRTVAATVEQDDGAALSAELKLGQHVEVEHDANLTAKSIQVVSAVEGTVVAVGSDTLTIMGQTVTINNDAAAGPVTVFGTPYQKLSDIQVNDRVQVHGLVKVDASGKSSIQATRIEKKNAADANRVRGTVTDLSTTANTFKVGDLLVSYANAKVTPASISLANGMELLLWVPQNATTTSGGAINASKVKIKDLKTAMQLANARLGGVVSKTDVTTKTFYLDAVKIDASAATFAQAGKSFADIKDGVYVRVMGAYQADGTLKANSIVLRAAEEQSSGAVELHGSILNFVSNADFTVRDVHVDASNAKISCTPATLTSNLQVEVDGQLTADGKVTATAVKCESVQDDQSVVERAGAAAKVDLAAKTLTVTTSTQTLTVQWSGRTVFVGVDQATLDGKTIEVEGTLSGGVLRATKIKAAL